MGAHVWVAGICQPWEWYPIAHFQDFWGKEILVSRDKFVNRNFAVKKVVTIFNPVVLTSNKWLQYFQSIIPKVTKIGFIIGHKIDYNGVKDQLHIPSTN